MTFGPSKGAVDLKGLLKVQVCTNLSCYYDNVAYVILYHVLVSFSGRLKVYKKYISAHFWNVL